jgi:hypothetical protein
MRIVLTSENFDGFAGTETYTLTVAQQLDALGHDVSIYSPNRGAIAQFARDQGVRVLGSDALPAGCDLLVFGDAATCHDLASRYRDAVRLFVSHSCSHALQFPPQLVGCCDAVILLNDRVRRAVEARSGHAPIVRLRQPIDTARFQHVGPPREQPRRALVLSNNVARFRAQLITRACSAAGIELAWIGAPTSSTATPEHAIADADLVIALGRSALEGMAAGRAVYVYGLVGGDGWVTPDRYAAMESDGFAGLSDRGLTIDAARLVGDLAGWDRTMGEVNRDLVYSHHSARDHAIELVSLARSLDSPQSFDGTAAGELARLVRRERQASGRYVGAVAEVGRLRSQAEQREHEAAALGLRVAEASAEIARLEESLGVLRGTRRYRLASRLARPLDRLRAHRDAKLG